MWHPNSDEGDPGCSKEGTRTDAGARSRLCTTDSMQSPQLDQGEGSDRDAADVGNTCHGNPVSVYISASSEYSEVGFEACWYIDLLYTVELLQIFLIHLAQNIPS